MIFTGHIASTDGTASMVKALPSKIEAAIKDPEIDCFVYPAIDASIQVLASQTKSKTEGALAQSKSQLQHAAIRDIGDLVRYAFTESNVVLASLKNKYFGENLIHQEKVTGPGKAVCYLVCDLEERFWHSLWPALPGVFQLSPDGRVSRN